MASLTTTGPTVELGGRSVDTGTGVNDGLVRCPRCGARLLSECGSLERRDEGADRVLWMPLVPTPDEARAAARAAEGERDGDGEDDGKGAQPGGHGVAADCQGAEHEGDHQGGGNAESTLAEGRVVADPAFTWKSESHEFWWRVEDVDDFDNVGLSRLVASPHGMIKVVLCSNCGNGPFGHQHDGEAHLWVACGRVEQVDASLRNDEEDFKPPDGVDVEALKQMIASGAATTRFHVVFEEQRLGMMLADAPAPGGGVHVHAFTVTDAGELGPAELCGDIRVGDVVTKVNGKSTTGLDYAGVLDLVCNAVRPLTLHFERSGKNSMSASAHAASAANGGVARVRHMAWNGGAEAEEESGGEEDRLGGGESKR